MNGAAGLRLGATGAGVRALCVLVHGRGQSPHDMESHIVERLGGGDVAFLLPRAPRSAWYDARAVDPISAVTGEQLAEALGHLGTAIASLRTEFPGRPLVLAGFSQGACLSIEYVCRGDAPPDALVALTGCRVGTVQCDRPRHAPRELPVYLSAAATATRGFRSMRCWRRPETWGSRGCACELISSPGVPMRRWMPR
jgi:phospholipase/carboxylesterase